MQHRDVPHRHDNDSAMHATPEAHAMSMTLSAFRWLAGLARAIVLLLAVTAMALVQGHPLLQENCAAIPPTARSRRRMKRPPPLQWRSPWWAWQFLAWSVATLTAPTFLLIGSLLLINSHSDQPLFWWSLPVIVAIGNAVAMLRINQLHHRDPFTDRQTLARRYAGTSMTVGATLFLLVGCISGLLPDVLPRLASAAGASFPTGTAAVWGAALAALFALLSFAHAGAVHAGLGFEARKTWWPPTATA